MPLAARAILLTLAMLGTVGCRVVEPYSASKSPLLPLSVMEDAVSLEVFTAPVPQGDTDLAALWKLVDEQSLPADLRKRLADNGFRAGILGPNIPAELAAILKLNDKPVEAAKQHVMSLNPEGTIEMRAVHAKSGKRIELTLPHVRPEVALLELANGEVRGKTYRQAECRLGLRAFPQPDGRLRLELTPELHHGEFQNRMKGSDGMVMFTQERPKRVFTELKLEPTLGPGQMFLLTGRSERSASPGYHFFTDTSGDKPVPLLWVVRAARAAADTAFYEAPPTDELSTLTNDSEE